MEQKERISDLQNTIVVTMEEGAQLGNVHQVFIDPQSKKLSAITFKENYRGREWFVEMSDVQRVGKDVVFVNSEASSQELTPDNMPSGRSFKDLQGFWVTTMEGDHVGTFVDLEVNTGDWTVAELRLSDFRALPVEPSKLAIGKDEILVASDTLANMTESKPDRSGFLGQTLGKDAMEQVTRSLQMAWKRFMPMNAKSRGEEGEEGDIPHIAKAKANGEAERASRPNA